MHERLHYDARAIRVAALVVFFGGAILRHRPTRAITSSDIPTITLSNGVEMPVISSGLWQVTPEEAAAMVPMALRVGFNHIDASCEVYHNQVQVGEALSAVPRDSFFLTSKLDTGPPEGPKKWPAATAYEQATSQLWGCVKSHGVSQLDLVLFHWPNSDCEEMQEEWRALEDFYTAGGARAIGVSNFCPSSLECIMETATVTPMVNQVLYHVGMGNDPLGIKSYCDARGIVLQAYSPLGAGTTDHPRTPELITGELVTSIGEKYGVSGAQVSLRWVVQNGVPVAAESTNEKHLAADLGIFGFTLSDEDMATLNAASSPNSPYPGRSYSFACDA